MPRPPQSQPASHFGWSALLLISRTWIFNPTQVRTWCASWKWYSCTHSNIASPNLLASGLMTYRPLLQTHIHQPLISTPLIGYWREIYREACQDPHNLNLLASTLVGGPYSWSVGHEFQSSAGQNLVRLMKVEDSGTRSNITSPHSLAAVTAANDTQATATKTHMPLHYQYTTNWVLKRAP